MLHIKSLSQSSYKEWVALWKHYLAFYHADFNAQQAEQTWARLGGQEFPHDRVYWLTQENNERARKLYDKVAQQTGFIQYKKSL